MLVALDTYVFSKDCLKYFKFRSAKVGTILGGTANGAMIFNKPIAVFPQFFNFTHVAFFRSNFAQFGNPLIEVGFIFESGFEVFDLILDAMLDYLIHACFTLGFPHSLYELKE